MQWSELKTHLQRDCIANKRRQALSTRALTRPPAPAPDLELLLPVRSAVTRSPSPHRPLTASIAPYDSEGTAIESPQAMMTAEEDANIFIISEQILCQDCGDSVVKGKQFTDHLESICRMRKIYCPNHAFGCLELVPLCQIEQHLRADCEHEKKKEVMIGNSKLRQELVACSGCGEKIPLSNMRQHEDHCSNRYVPCRNHALGCSFNVRMADRAIHEHVDGSAFRRSCLYLGPGGAHVNINEDDMSPPWTVEFWVYRCSWLETAKNSLLGIKHRRAVFRMKFLEEKKIHHKILQLKKEMHELTKQQHEIFDANGVNVKLFRREAALDEMAKHTSEYEDAAVASEKAGKQLLVTLSAALSCLEVQVAIDGSKLVPHLRPEPPGIDTAKAQAKLNNIVPFAEKAEEEKEMVILTAPDGNVNDVNVPGLAHGDDEVDRRSGLLVDPLIDFSVTDLSVFDWLQRVLKVKTNYELELALLTKWRDDASLVSKRATSGGKGVVSAGTKSNKERAAARRREARKSTNASNSGVGKAASSASSSLSSSPMLHERLTANALTSVGNEVLLSSTSSPNKICLDVEAGSGSPGAALEESRGRVGFVTAEGVFAFDANVTRSKWTHIALVCTSSPKKRVTCYVNGLSTGKLSTAFALPMSALGCESLDHSFVGCLLDVRIWSVPRSTKQILLSMHSLLTVQSIALTKHTRQQLFQRSSSRGSGRATSPLRSGSARASSAEKNDDSSLGLVAYWTFEDARCKSGWSTTVSDTSDQRYQIAVISNTPRLSEHAQNFTWLDPSSLPPKNVPMPSYRDRNLCKYEVRRFRLSQKGRALMNEVPCPNNCGEKVRKLDMRFHRRHECSLRIVQCSVPYCRENYVAINRLDHDSNSCAAVIMRARLIEEGKHLNQVLLCTLCSEPIRLRDLQRHNAEECDHRIISCPYNDCTVTSLEAHQLDHHLMYECRSRFVLFHRVLVRRARERVHYPRPWGVHIDYEGNDVYSRENHDRFDGEQTDEVENAANDDSCNETKQD